MKQSERQYDETGAPLYICRGCGGRLGPQDASFSGPDDNADNYHPACLTGDTLAEAWARWAYALRGEDFPADYQQRRADVKKAFAELNATIPKHLGGTK